MIDRAHFGNDPGSVTLARRFAQRQLEGVPQSVLESALLIVSELTTNCIRHARTSFEVDVEIEGDQIRIAITDEGDGTPEMRHPNPEAASGRGLQIVALLSSEWGVVPSSRQRGKTVWFCLDLREPQASALSDAAESC